MYIYVVNILCGNVQDCPLVLSSDFPCIFHQFSIQCPLRKACQHSRILFSRFMLILFSLIGLCALGIYNARVMHALTSSWVTVPTPAVCTTCWTRVSRQCQVWYLHGHATATSTPHLLQRWNLVKLFDILPCPLLSD